MMTTPMNSISLFSSGDRYKPSLIGVEFASQHDAGEARKYGGERIGCYPSGMAQIKVDLTAPWEDSIRAFVALVEKVLPDLKKAGADDYYILIEYNFEGQCNLEFSTESVKLMSSINCPLCFSCYGPD
jgi:hypothetical protein